MQTLRIILVTLICGAMLFLLLSTLWNGLRTGKLRWRDAASVCDRQKQPLLYWMLVVVFTGFALLFLVAWVMMF